MRPVSASLVMQVIIVYSFYGHSGSRTIVLGKLLSWELLERPLSNVVTLDGSRRFAEFCHLCQIREITYIV